MLKELILILMGGVLINNYVLQQFLGICPFLGVSKKFNQASGMGIAVTFVMLCATAVTHPIYTYALVPLKLQYLQTKQDKKDWMAALLEVNFAPHWSIFASDMYNHGSSKVHYYNAGVSYAKSRTRIALGYGRYKAGYI